MLGPDIPDRPPLGTAAQEGFVRTSFALALHLRAHSWAEADLGAAGVRGQDDVPHPGERLAADAFDVLGRLMLPHASPEGWTATLITDLARDDERLEAAVKLGKYVLHPTFLGFGRVARPRDRAAPQRAPVVNRGVRGPRRWGCQKTTGGKTQ
ncbi:hypothetical protein ABT300_43080, partial [Streptomyces sp. NPDC001027]